MVRSHLHFDPLFYKLCAYFSKELLIFFSAMKDKGFELVQDILAALMTAKDAQERGLA